MVLEEFCVVSLSKKNREYYISKGYDVVGSKITIKILDMNPGSHKKIRVSCDICFSEKYLPWREYMRSINNGGFYSCSSSCAKSKIKATNLDRYGVDNPTKSKDILKKRENNNLKKYGVTHPMKLEVTKNRLKNTMLDRYGVDNPTKSKEIYSRVRQSIKDKYGDEVMFKTEHFRNNINNYKRRLDDVEYFEKRKVQLNKHGICLIGVFGGDYIIKCNKGHTYSITNDILYKRLFVYNVDVCTVCNVINNSSFAESELYEFIRSVYDGNIICNNRSVINPYEIDIYLPDIGLAFEFNGVFWHSDIFKNDKYHKMKHDLCLDKNIQLIQIWEDDWCYKRDIVKSIIVNKIGLSDRIYARNTKLVVYNNNKVTKGFLDKNHLQGNCKSSIKIGLLYNGELVSLMLFSKNRYGVGNIKGGEFELVRFCNKLNITVVGSASKILSYFNKKYEFESIFSFSDNDISDGGLYKLLGFDFDYDIKPTYYYVVGNKREHRFKWRKSNLIKNNLLVDGETEKSCMCRLNYNRVYNSGHKKWYYLSH